MFEVSESEKFKPVDQSPVSVGGKTWPALVRDTIVGAINTKLISSTDQIVSIYHRRASEANQSSLFMSFTRIGQNSRYNAHPNCG